MPDRTETPSACLLIIGNEILSGKTQDANLKFLGTSLAAIGIRLEEARVLRDDEHAIIASLNECRAKFTYVFTTGGIGPTHDDITAECVAKAFGRALVLNEEAAARLKRSGHELNVARLKMAHVPEGADLIDNPLSNAPGFRVDNVFVLAGIPSVVRAMFSSLSTELGHGTPIHTRSVDIFLKEGDIAAPLQRIALKYPDIDIGSYPFSRDGRYGASLVARGTRADLIEAVLDEIIAAMTELGGESSIGARS